MRRNTHFSQVASRYLFQEIRERKRDFLQQYPHAELISLSIGDTTEPITPHICQGLTSISSSLGSEAGYMGYGPEQGILELRQAIATTLYHDRVDADDVFVSDGAKCDIGRLQTLFGPETSVALQDPAYPAYLDTSIIHRGRDSIILLPCTPENHFFPDLALAEKADVLFLCSPNNPTGALFSHEQLATIVQFAKDRKKIIVFDTAYSLYIQGDGPRSIYEIAGAKEVAIEIGSFSKIAGFSGVRLGWTVVPKELHYHSGEPVRADWMRLITTFYNGSSIISQHGGIAALQPAGMSEMRELVSFYLESTGLLLEAFKQLGYEVYGGIHAPYLWVRLQGKSSWDAFDELLRTAHVLTTPGIGFGESGDGFLRISGFGKRATILEAIGRLHRYRQ